MSYTDKYRTVFKKSSERPKETYQSREKFYPKEKFHPKEKNYPKEKFQPREKFHPKEKFNPKGKFSSKREKYRPIQVYSETSSESEESESSTSEEDEPVQPVRRTVSKNWNRSVTIKSPSPTRSPVGREKPRFKMNTGVSVEVTWPPKKDKDNPNVLSKQILPSFGIQGQEVLYIS